MQQPLQVKQECYTLLVCIFLLLQVRFLIAGSKSLLLQHVLVRLDN